MGVKNEGIDRKLDDCWQTFVAWGSRLFSALTAIMVGLSFVATAQGQLDIVINAGSGLQGNTAALEAFERAAVRWESIFSDNITVNIDADLVSFAATGAGGPTAIGGALSQETIVDYDVLRGELIADGVADGDAITALLPSAAQLTAFAPGGGAFSGNVRVNTANLRAIDEDNSLGLLVDGASDGDIAFNSDFTFDFDSSDGVVATAIDFETVAAHEIGHVLGFISQLDQAEQDFLDGGLALATFDLSPFDLFRFDDIDLPTSTAEFTNNPRSIVPGRSSSFSDLTDTLALSTGEFLGDGRQGSHFLDDALSGTTIGILDPTLTPGVVTDISSADIRVFDLIGFNSLNAIAVPEPSGATLLAIAGIGCAVLSRKRVL